MCKSWYYRGHDVEKMVKISVELNHDWRGGEELKTGLEESKRERKR